MSWVKVHFTVCRYSIVPVPFLEKINVSPLKMTLQHVLSQLSKTNKQTPLGFGDSILFHYHFVFFDVNTTVP